MKTVGIRELKNGLTYYLRLTREGSKVVVTDRGTPVAVISSVDKIENDAGVEERLALLARQSKLRLPLKRGMLRNFRAVETPGKPPSEVILEERK